jgi:hypothetical protein
VKRLAPPTQLAGVAFMERDRQMLRSGAFSREPDQVARAVYSSNLTESASRKLERMSPLSAAEIEDAIIVVETGRLYDQIHLAPRIVRILHNIAVGFQICRIEQRPPPIGW